MPYITELSSRATVYRFGARWHWKCGATRDEQGLCLGGPAHTQEDAYAKAFDHITDEHCEQLVVPTDPDGCRYCGVILAEHDLLSASWLALGSWVLAVAASAYRGREAWIALGWSRDPR